MQRRVSPLLGEIRKLSENRRSCIPWHQISVNGSPHVMPRNTAEPTKVLRSERVACFVHTCGPSCERKSWRRELPRYRQFGNRSHLSQNSTPETLKSDSTHQLACSLCHTRRWPASFPLRALPVHHLQPSFRFDPKLRAVALCRRLHHLRQLMIRRDSSGTSSQQLRTSIRYSSL